MFDTHNGESGVIRAFEAPSIDGDRWGCDGDYDINSMTFFVYRFVHVGYAGHMEVVCRFQI